VIFFDELLNEVNLENIADRVEKEKQKDILIKYLEIFDISDSQEVWFEKIKNLASELGFEKVGDVAMVLRVAITHRTRTPDLYQVMQVLGEQVVRERIQKYVDIMI